MIENLNYFDAFLNVLGIIGTWPAIQRLCYSRSPTPLESKLKWILISLTAMMLVRIPYIGFKISEMGPLVYLFAISSAYCVFLYLETLMRKHLPLWTKLYITFGSLYFVSLTLGNRLARDMDNLLIFAFFVSSMAVIALFLAFFRTRTEHSKVENSLIDQLGVTIILLTPLLLTDIFSYGLVGLPRFGVAGILILTYFSLYNQAMFSTRSKVFKKILKSIGFSVLLTFAMGLLAHGGNFAQWSLAIEGRIFVLCFCVNLIFRIHFAVKQLDGDEDMFNFLKIVNESRKTSVGGFLKDLNSFFGNMDRVVLSNGSLKDFDIETFLKLMEPNPSSVFSIFELKTMIEENEDKKNLNRKEVQAIEQMIHLLEKHEMTYISQIGKRTPHFLLFNVPMAAYRETIDVKNKIIHDMSILIEKQMEIRGE
jgi:hypothetical protein